MTGLGMAYIFLVAVLVAVLLALAAASIVVFL